MRVIVMIRANEKTEAGVMPSEELLTEMGKYNEELVKAGVILAGEGLHPSSKGARVKSTKGKITVTDGPFPGSKDLICGYWLIQVKSKAEAIEWAKRVPFKHIPQNNGTGEIELRQLFELEDFGESPAVEHHRELSRELSNAN